MDGELVVGVHVDSRHRQRLAGERLDVADEGIFAEENFDAARGKTPELLGQAVDAVAGRDDVLQGKGGKA